MISKYNSKLITPPLTDMTNITYSIKDNKNIVTNIPIMPNMHAHARPQHAETPYTRTYCRQCTVPIKKKRNYFILPTAIFILINYVNKKWNKIKLEKQLEKEKKIEHRKYREYMLRPLIFY